MTIYRINKLRLIAVASVLLGSITGCNHNDDSTMTSSAVTYEIDVINATNAQPMTPVAVIAHTSGYKPWVLGGPASVGLEMLAEGGDVSRFIADATADSAVMGSASSSNGPFGPGTTESVMVSVDQQQSDLQISVASMLADTNDAFTGIANVPVGALSKGDSVTMLARVYDAGTESNTESASTIPGPAGGGEGFNAARDDTNFVSIHAGVVTADDGLASSALNEGDRWLGPAAKITITRMN